jgi:hypothetical protein
MAGLKIVACGLALLFVTLSSLVRAQEPTIAQPHRKWLDCDIDWIFSEETVGPRFSLQMSFKGSAIPGVQIFLSQGGNAVATARTNSCGVAHFDTIPPGKYDSGSSNGLLYPSRSLLIEVKADHKLGEKLKLDWPGYSYAYRFLRGRFTTSDLLSDPDIPLQNAVVELRDVYTAKLIESGSTDANGDYEFATTDPGLYALRLVLPKKGEAGFENRDLPIVLDPAAKKISIPQLRVVQSDCAGVQLFRWSPSEGRWEAQ